MRRFSAIFILIAILACSCSQRPKLHHPQPEASAKQQILRVFYASVDAFIKHDNQRISSLVSDNCIQYNENMEKTLIVPEHSISPIYNNFFASMSETETLNWLVKHEQELLIMGKHEIESEKPENRNQIINAFSSQILKNEFLLMAPPTENQPKSLVLLFSTANGAWQIKAISLI